MTDSPYGLRVALSTQVFGKPVTSPASVPSLDLLRVWKSNESHKKQYPQCLSQSQGLNHFWITVRSALPGIFCRNSEIQEWCKYVSWVSLSGQHRLLVEEHFLCSLSRKIGSEIQSRTEEGHKIMCLNYFWYTLTHSVTSLLVWQLKSLKSPWIWLGSVESVFWAKWSLCYTHLLPIYRNAFQSQIHILVIVMLIYINIVK